MRQSRRSSASANVERAGGAFIPMWNSLVWLAARQASMSRSDSRQVSCAKAMTRNSSAQVRVRTPASPLCRSTMRPKVFHGTNSITCANSVLPTFMRHLGSVQPESIANSPPGVQIVDTPESPETTANAGFTVGRQQIDRTLVLRRDELDRRDLA